jgi:hypothetical protein
VERDDPLPGLVRVLLKALEKDGIGGVGWLLERAIDVPENFVCETHEKAPFNRGAGRGRPSPVAWGRCLLLDDVFRGDGGVRLSDRYGEVIFRIERDGGWYMSRFRSVASEAFLPIDPMLITR